MSKKWVLSPLEQKATSLVDLSACYVGKKYYIFVGFSVDKLSLYR